MFLHIYGEGFKFPSTEFVRKIQTDKRCSCDFQAQQYKIGLYIVYLFHLQMKNKQIPTISKGSNKKSENKTESKHIVCADGYRCIAKCEEGSK